MPLPAVLPAPSSRSRRVAGGLVLAATLATSACASSASDSASGSGGSTGTLRVSGSTTVNPVVADAAEVLRGQGLDMTVDTQGGSAGGLAQLGAGQIDVAMSSKPVGDADRAAYPQVAFTPTEIGQDAVGIVVRKEVVDGGLKDIDKDRLRRLFEGSVRNWKEIGGPDLPTFVYDKEPGRGTREVLDKYLYGPTGKAPAPPADNPRYAVVGGNEETRSKLLSTPGSVAPLSSAFVEGQPQLAVLSVGGVAPTPQTIANSSYPMSRPLFLVTNGPATGGAKRLIDYVVGAEGQQLVTKHGYLTLAQLKQ